jgi:hypothetical protein
VNSLEGVPQWPEQLHLRTMNLLLLKFYGQRLVRGDWFHESRAWGSFCLFGCFNHAFKCPVHSGKAIFKFEVFRKLTPTST